MAPAKATPGNCILEMKGISKTFGAFKALNKVSLAVNEGEILALLGENGAGKSTLMKILSGIYTATEGSVHLDDKACEINSVKESQRLGIILIHQELNLLDNLDVAGNIFLGREPVKAFKLIDLHKLYADADELLKLFGLTIPSATSVSKLSIAEQQIIEIIKALSQHARIIIMDEPTSSLTLKETDLLFEIIRNLKAKGISIIYISHRLNEIIEIADRVVVLKDGQNSGELQRREINHDNLVRLMIGRDIFKSQVAPWPYHPASSFEIRDLSTYRYTQHGVNLRLSGGEILGISGLVGAGRTELVNTIFGIHRATGGTMHLNGAEITVNNPADAISKGIFLVPEDRRNQGIVASMNIIENLTLPNLPATSAFKIISRRKEAALSTAKVEELNVKAPTLRTNLKDLSGGNQQKIAIGKWLSRNPSLLIFDEPTRGVDIGAKAEIYNILRNLAKSGVMIIVVSSDMEEIINISHRILVMHEGKISGQLEPEEFTEENIMRYAVGLN
ncbi:sugar ABC transporter ATP-binding protein [Pedobacter psychroterrae]|uniref:Sugar ABC transporter ATP-binding protein n=1 Tax=Pedobacter psychroterrae TaxID=2530453 RepID=A0A4R0NE95_9SPHI|nr:sugar ABC transporter ATP-binding protein [Pedobacter psychroterrae]TCC96874.1 sugar ABC transporter ATP-binding protein [Pedobacter psychroterrae]